MRERLYKINDPHFHKRDGKYEPVDGRMQPIYSDAEAILMRMTGPYCKDGALGHINAEFTQPFMDIVCPDCGAKYTRGMRENETEST